MNSALTRFQDDFVQTLLAPPSEIPPVLGTLALQPGFAVYRNTVMKGCIDALQANFPAVLRLVGEEWFRAAAALHVRAQMPDDVRLLQYGAHFPVFLQSFPPAEELPYLWAVAQLDRFWTEAHIASDADVLAPSVLAGLTPEQMGELVLTPHPAARWAWYGDQPIYTLWQRNRDVPCMGDADDVTWCGEGALITRPAGQVQWTALGAAGCAFLDACGAGQPLVRAAQDALSRDAQVDLAQLMASLLNAGAFSATNPVCDTP